MKIEQRALGSLLGLACGDAVGTSVEFYPRGQFTPITDMQGGGEYGLEKGKWTDDTSLALCLAESLVACQTFDPVDQLRRYCQWADEGVNSSLPQSFGIGSHTQKSLQAFQRTGNPYSEIKSEYTGNGSLMRLCPVVLFYHDQPELAVKYAGLSSKTTHSAAECVESCQYFATLLTRIFTGTNKADLFRNEDAEHFPHLADVCRATFKHKTAEQINGSCNVIESIEAALWAFWHTDNFKDAILAAANLGDDADTTGAICGQIAGAYYGVDNIPPSWLDVLYRKDDIANLALALVQQH